MPVLQPGKTDAGRRGLLENTLTVEVALLLADGDEAVRTVIVAAGKEAGDVAGEVVGLVAASAVAHQANY